MILGLLLSLVASFAQMSGGYIVLSNKRWLGTGEESLLAIGAGFLMALVFIELIPESIHLTYNSQYAVIAMLIGFSTIHFFEHTVVEHLHFGEEKHMGLSHSSTVGAIGGLSLHAFFDGMSIAAAASAKPKLGILVFIAVLLHKIPEGLTVASVMVAGQKSKQEARLASIALATATLLGAVMVLLFVTLDETWIGFIFGFSAGSSLYVGACDLIPEINKSRGRKAPVLVFFGMLLFYLGKLGLDAVLGKY